MPPRARFEVFQGAEDLDGTVPEWYWRLKAVNGEIVAQSEGYPSKEHAERGAEACQRVAQLASGAIET